MVSCADPKQSHWRKRNFICSFVGNEYKVLFAWQIQPKIKLPCKMFKERKWDLLLTDSGLFTFKRVLVSLEKVFSLHSTTRSIFPNAGFH